MLPLALAGCGGHLATLALADPQRKRRALWLVWGLAAAGVICCALQQIGAYHSDKEHNEEETTLQGKLDASLQRQEYMRGQLDSIGLMLGKIGEKTNDAGLKDFASAISAAIDRMARQLAQQPPAPKHYQREGTEKLQTKEGAEGQVTK